MSTIITADAKRDVVRRVVERAKALQTSLDWITGAELQVMNDRAGYVSEREVAEWDPYSEQVTGACMIGAVKLAIHDLGLDDARVEHYPGGYKVDLDSVVEEFIVDAINENLTSDEPEFFEETVEEDVYFDDGEWAGTMERVIQVENEDYGACAVNSIPDYNDGHCSDKDSALQAFDWTLWNL
jgi:hypothetical protein